MSNYSEYCHNCGSAVAEPSAFCSSCGVELAEPDRVSEALDGAAHGSRSRSDDGAARDRQRSPAAAAVADSSAADRTGARSQYATGRSAAPPRPSGSVPHEAGVYPDSSPPAPAPPSQPPPSEGRTRAPRRWAPAAAIACGILVVAAIVAVLLLALGGSAGKNVKSAAATREQALQLLAANGTTTVSRVAPGLFAAVTAGTLSTIIPAGWRATGQAAAGVSRAEFANPRAPSSTLTIVAQKGGSASDHARALAAQRAVKGRGFDETAFGPVSFAGGREPWRVTYVKTGVTHETFFFSACEGATAMVVDASAASNIFAREQPTLRTAVASAEPAC